ncbi:MAG: CAF17-like 4Fe-4S cluster assembly/insertion protein YgfZ [Burkholderiaceae bacterium]
MTASAASTGSAASSADALPAGPSAVRLSDWGVIRARGEDAASFLNGQLTQDMASLAPGQARLAGYCTAKGRLLASFVVWRPAADEILLACSADLLATTLKRLSMYVLRAKCKLTDASAELALWGAVIPGAVSSDVPAEPWSAAPAAAGTAIRLPDAEGRARVLWAAPADASPPCPATTDAAAWNWLEVQAGVPRVVARTSEAFVPQMVNLELVGGVNFKKGCYPGQEIVARSQYRGTVKRRMVLVEGEAAPEAGTEVFSAAEPGEPAGQVVLSASLAGGRHAALVEVKRALVDGGEFHAGAADGPRLAVRELPYALPALDAE